jgi:hypothetical protein
MRVVFTDDVTDDTGRLFIGFIPIVVQFAHGEKNTPVNRLQAIAHIGQGTPDNNAHSIIKIGLFEFVLDVYREDFISYFTHKIWRSLFLKSAFKPVALPARKQAFHSLLLQAQIKPKSYHKSM